MAKFIARFIGLIAILLATPLMAEPVKTAHLTTELVAETTVTPQGETWLAIVHTPLKGWHTYWKNPGDTGLAPVVTWTLPAGVEVGELQFPTPEVQPYLGLTNYGYSGETWLLAKLTNHSALTSGVLPLKARVDFLVCEKICVPETVNLSLDLKVGPTSEPLNSSAFTKARAALPVPVTITAAYDLTDGLRLGFKANDNTPLKNDFAHAGGVYVFPVNSGLIDPSAPQIAELGPEGFSVTLKSAKGFEAGQPLETVVRFASGRSYLISATAGQLPAGTYGLGKPPAGAPDITVGGIGLAMGLAFLGGMILNLMPCVFPVLSMKLMSLARAGHDGSMARKESLFYGLGVLVTFIVLALLLMALGSALGWGFQLQSPWITAGLTLLLLAVALNMSGLFEVGGSLQSLAGKPLSTQNPNTTAFLTGILAVMVAAPCTAPFMATAIGVALAQGGIIALAVFLALGLGFAVPLVGLTWLITGIPAAARFLPKPGPWMDRLRQILAIPMYLAALWMAWVFAQQVSGAGLILLITAAFLLTVALWWPKKLTLPPVTRSVLAGLAIALTAVAAMQKPQAPKTEIGELADQAIDHERFSTARIAELRASNTPVLVNMTAAWCVTCKVNEHVVFASKAFQQGLETTGTVYMVGDWTNRDAAISQYLSQNGRSGVPLYVYYGPDNAEPVILDQLLSTKSVLRTLEGKTK
ncbi:protein-disulfide reductase DsbD family protein [Asticcacaulis tiandongensis]|uniref:protein-disulfide reductase DsbD family protein n=1 Tax=Asticcacaulis tiandongensis TaxID=2565365 RepID=UPI001FEB1C86|nr:protein-disulfide reductase DsbD domain-containing protein [Asticcacaulis tiandongensis]